MNSSPDTKATTENLHTLITNATPRNDGLLSGRLGLALYYFTRWQALDTLEDAEKAQDLLEEVYNNLEADKIQLYTNTFAGGAAGLAYVVNLFYQHELVDIDPAEDLADLDEFLFSSALEQIEVHDRIDYLHGATGIIHYFNQRLPDAKIESYLTRLIEALSQKAVREERGLWFRNWVMEPQEMEDINLSLSHGLCGFLLILCETWEAGLQLPVIRELVEEGLRYIRSFQQSVSIEDNQWSFFPSTIRAADQQLFFKSNRLAWCYGDFAPVLLLHRAGKLFQNEDWIQQSAILGTFTLMRKTPEATANTESLVCHGSAGMAEFYKTLHRETGIDRYQEGHAYWIGQTLELLKTELETGHYKDKEGDLLEGLAGINMVLLGAISDLPLSWPRALLM